MLTQIATANPLTTTTAFGSLDWSKPYTTAFNCKRAMMAYADAHGLSPDAFDVERRGDAHHYRLKASATDETIPPALDRIDGHSAEELAAERATRNEKLANQEVRMPKSKIKNPPKRASAEASKLGMSPLQMKQTGAKPKPEKAASEKKPKPAKATARAPGELAAKPARLLELLKASGGAKGAKNAEELAKAIGIQQAHSISGMLSRLRTSGVTITSSKDEKRGRVYWIA